MKSIHKTCVESAGRLWHSGNYVNGANIGGLSQGRPAMMEQGLV